MASADDAKKGLVQTVVLRHGAPNKLITNQSGHFAASLVANNLELMSTNRVVTRSGRPQTDEPSERFNRTFAMYVSSNHSDWNEFLS